MRFKITIDGNNKYRLYYTTKIVDRWRYAGWSDNEQLARNKAMEIAAEVAAERRKKRLSKEKTFDIFSIFME